VIQSDGLSLVDARFQDQPARAHRRRRPLEVVNYCLADSLSAHLWFYVHSFQLGGRWIDKAKRPASDGHAVSARKHKGAVARREMFGPQVRSEPLLRRVQVGEVCVERGDEPACIGGFERLGRDGDIRGVFIVGSSLAGRGQRNQ